ncbi:short-chain dehydrogenase/reductase SDR [Bacillus methanolicus PB1]|uniref:Short-chain dehydrogenase/reductase SDR n=1 Tax=Bacillus methanolicus PB1 TaxID=997296 RepID=I3E5C4_BACMT|nr:SDR family oxidoreductase [Bacillus methanolicus]EIJ81695.1 short-chain dehydrogenase/reductase SDR [Bacillus methanolicus PB1]
MDLKLSGKTALIAASSQGLGRAIAEGLLKEGANVVISGRDESKLKQVVTEIDPEGSGKAAFVRADVTNQNDIKEMVQTAINSFGRLDILVNNAGGPPAGSFESLTDEDWQASFELNLLSYIRLIREALPVLKMNGGKIINIASSSIKEPIPGLILSNTFRTAIVGLSKTLAQELAPYNILINTVAPGRIATDRVRRLDQVNAEKLGITREEVEAKIKESIPLKRYGTPQEFANFVVFLASEANTYVTGSSFLIDGGMIKSI